MSTILSKRLKTSKDDAIYQRDSFERFGDDLIEVIISNLSFDDKFRYESVSKQFQRLIFNKIDTIDISHQRLNSISEPFTYERKINIKALHTVLKKCPNIRKVFSARDAMNEEDVLRTVIDNCDQLHEIKSDFENLKNETIDKFCTKFGEKLKKMNFIPNNQTVKKIMRSCPNLETVGYYWINLEDLFEDNELLVKRLKSISLYYSSDDSQRISTFVESNRNTIRNLEIIVYDKFLTTIHTKILYDKLSELTHLRSLGIYYYVSTDDSVIHFAQELSVKCPKLKKIDFNLRINRSENVNTVFKSFDGFKELKSVVFKNHSEDARLIPIISQSLKNCKSLQQLRISVNTLLTNDEFFVSIDKHLPKLSSLHLTNAHISGQALRSLSKLPELRSLSLISLSLKSLIIESDVFEFIQNCHKIKSIYLVNSGFSCDFSQIDIKMSKDIINPAVLSLDYFDDNVGGFVYYQVSGEETTSDSDLMSF